MLKPVSSYKNFNEFWLDRVEASGNCLCLVDGQTCEKKFTYGQVNDYVDRAAFLLLDKGLKKGDRFAVLMDNCLDFFFLYLASLKVGTLMVPITPSFCREEILTIIHRFKPSLVFSDEQRKPLADSLKDGKGPVREVLLCGAYDVKNSFFSIISSLGKVNVSYEGVKLDEPGSLYCSSGTTGNPKGIPQSALNLLTAAQALNRAYGFGPKDTQMGILPACHTALATYGFWPGVFASSSFVLFKKFSRKNFWRDIDKHKIAFVETVPTVLSMLLNPAEDISGYDLSSLKFIGSGSAPLSNTLWEKFEETFGIRIANKYGLSETEPTHFNPPTPSKRKAGSIGRALDMCEVKIFDSEGKEKPDGETGELVMRGDNVVRGYFEDAQETAEAFRQGWFYSGDMGYKDKDGFFFLTGRKKEIIIRAGVNIYPNEVDNVLSSHPEVIEAVCFGVPDNIYGEEVYAAVKLKPQSAQNPDELISYCRERLAEHKCPKRVFIVDSTPKTASGKPLRRQLSAGFKAEKYPVISFLVSTYNAQKQLETCLKSIRGQDYPQDKVEILIADGGSTDSTLAIAEKYKSVISNNPRRLAEYGLAINAMKAKGDFFVITAADNELKGKDWLKRMITPFLNDPELSAQWGRLVSGKDDCPINNYYAIIQNDPLTFFTNQNLNSYLKKGEIKNIKGEKYYVFDACPNKPLPWGANCLVYRAAGVKHFWDRDEYVGDNDIFQMMIESGKKKIAYNPDLETYHHTVGTLFDWVGKWRRNLGGHFLENRQTRNLNWINVSNFKLRLVLWLVYTLFFPLILMHSIYLAARDRNIYWLYHPLVSFAQALTYLYVIFSTSKGRKLILDFFEGKKL